MFLQNVAFFFPRCLSENFLQYSSDRLSPLLAREIFRVRKVLAKCRKFPKSKSQTSLYVFWEGVVNIIFSAFTQMFRNSFAKCSRSLSDINFAVSFVFDFVDHHFTGGDSGFSTIFASLSIDKHGAKL